MKTKVFLLSALLLANAAPLTAQETRKPGSAKPGSAKSGAADQATIEQLIEKLGNADYEIRKAAERDLLGHGSAALEMLKKTAEKHDDPEVQWRAGRLVRQIQTGGAGNRKSLGKREGSEKDDVERVEKPGGRASVEDALKELDRIFDGGQFDEDARQSIEKAMERMRKSLRELDGSGFGGKGFDDFGRGFDGHGFDIRIPELRMLDLGEGRSSSGKSTKISQGPDGVRVEITEKGEDGEKKTKVYEAENMESFKKKYPDVLKSGSVRRPFRVLTPRLFRDGEPSRLRRGDSRKRTGAGTGERPRGLRKKTDRGDAGAVSGEGKKLGFYVGEISPAVRDYLELEGGLMVQSVVRDSLAEKLGVKKGDIVVRVGDKKIHDVEDVAASLEAIGDGKVTVDVIRRGRKVALR